MSSITRAKSLVKAMLTSPSRTSILRMLYYVKHHFYKLLSTISLRKSSKNITTFILEIQFQIFFIIGLFLFHDNLLDRTSYIVFEFVQNLLPVGLFVRCSFLFQFTGKQFLFTFCYFIMPLIWNFLVYCRYCSWVLSVCILTCSLNDTVNLLFVSV